MQDVQKEIDQFAKVDERIYRGAQPTPKGIALLKELGIKTIINFRHEPDAVEEEAQWVAEAGGIQYINIPWRIQVHPDKNVMREFLEVVARWADRGPLFFHCRRGAERTGVADAVYRRYIMGSSEEEAWDKATDDYHILFYWRPFMKKRLQDFYRDLGDPVDTGKTA